MATPTSTPSSSFDSALFACNLAYARRMFDKFSSPNIFLYTAIINAYTSVPDHVSAVLLYRDMVRENRSKPNHFMFSIILKSWPEVLPSYGVELVQTQIVKSGFGGNPVVQTAILDAYSRYGFDVGRARKVFDEISDRNVVSWTAMISGYARAGQVGNAVLLFEEMPEGIRDTPFWNSIIAGCAQNGLFSEAIEFFRRMVFEEGWGQETSRTRVLSSAFFPL
ncbi:UNVERIFIED_CONTAM: Pentatricopeptide repeat-containing protein [Sesamum radiatum]|uniref:Pentatricopeptide repeat-containing protein n=1 Tax=Sesamum radiatum TaxID=300843 RepID=A0AAW2TW84_SESRA